MGWFLTLESEWKPALGESLLNQLEAEKDNAKLSIGCVTSHGYFFRENENDEYNLKPEAKAAATFLFRLISELQFSGTVPMINIKAYGDWLLEED